MTSQLNVDTIVDKAGTSGPSLPNTTTIKIGNTSTYVSDGGAVTQNTVQGLLKSWVQINQSGTQAIQDSLNVASITDVTTGVTTVTIANDMANDDYSVTTAGNSESTIASVGIYSGCSVVNTTDCTVSGRRNNANADSTIFGVQIAGDLA